MYVYVCMRNFIHSVYIYTYYICACMRLQKNCPQPGFRYRGECAENLTKTVFANDLGLGSRWLGLCTSFILTYVHHSY